VSFSDTSKEALELQVEIRRAMSGEQLLDLALDMSLFARELAREGLRLEHPDWTEDQVSRELLRRAFLPHPLPAGLQ
jgi:hypothetical protein